MLPFYLRDTRDLTDALDLIEATGDAARQMADAHGDRGRDIGNVVVYCRWRQIGRLIAFLSEDGSASTLH